MSCTLGQSVVRFQPSNLMLVHLGVAVQIQLWDFLFFFLQATSGWMGLQVLENINVQVIKWWNKFIKENEIIWKIHRRKTILKQEGFHSKLLSNQIVHWFVVYQNNTGNLGEHMFNSKQERSNDLIIIWQLFCSQ